MRGGAHTLSRSVWPQTTSAVGKEGPGFISASKYALKLCRNASAAAPEPYRLCGVLHQTALISCQPAQ